ncbi:MAG: ABC transporter permease [bacterium]
MRMLRIPQILRSWIARVRGTLHSRDVEARLDEEIRFHLDMHTEQRVRSGVSPDDARRAALVAFGGREPWREATRDEYRSRWVEGIWNDVRFAVRTLRRSPGFTIVALLTFALGIGANTAVFSVVSGILLRPLPYANPTRLASIWPDRTLSGAELAYLQQHAKSFAAVSAFSPGWGIAMTGAGDPRQLDAARVSTNYFQTLGAHPVIGRSFADGESSEGHWDVMVVSHALWISQFGGDPNVVGKIVDCDGSPTLVVGVMPADFEAFQPGVDAWLPLQIDAASPFYTGQVALGFGRLARGATFASAAAETATLVPQMRAAFNYSEDYGKSVTVVDLHDRLVGDIRQSLFVLLGAVAFVLLIAGANVGNLMLVHATGRRRELAVRRALGASRGQIVQQLLIQSLLIASVGGALGTIVGVAGVRGLKALLPSTLPLLSSVSVDWRVLVVSAGITLAVGLLFGVAPALTASRVDPDGALRIAASSGANRAGVATRRTLVIVEIALAMVLVVGAGLMTESLWRMSRVDLGFDARNVLSFRLQPSSGQAPSVEKLRVYFDETSKRLATIPGVVAVGASQHLPLSGFNWSGDLDIETQPVASTAAHPRIVWRTIVGDYFTAMKIPLRRGRLFTSADTRDAPPVVVISERMARHYWPDRDPIGQRIRAGNATRKEWATIVGVVGTVNYLGPQTPPGDEIYRPNAQQGQSGMHFVVRTSGEPLTLAGSVRSAIRSFDATVPVAELRSLGDLFVASTATPRAIAWLLLAFAGVGVVLGAVGVYGVIAYAVNQRTRELGIRIALGAMEGRIVTMVVGEGARMAAVGIAIGAVAGVIAARSLRTLVFGVATTDVATYTVVAALIALVALAAAYIPARRASRVDALVALRSD